MKTLFTLLISLVLIVQTQAQIDITYQVPDEAILELADAPMTPSMRINSKGEIQVKGLPEPGRLSNFGWSPDESFMAFTNTTQNGVELWLLDISKAEAKKPKTELTRIC